MRFVFPAALVLSSVLLSSPMVVASAQSSSARKGAASRQQVSASYGRLPLSFTANQGQADRRTAYLAQGGGYSIALERATADVTLTVRSRSVKKTQNQLAAHGEPTNVLRLGFPGARTPRSVSGLEQLPGASNYLIGNDASDWHLGVPNYARVKYAQVYPGVDVVYYGNQQQLEFDFVVAPRADASVVRIDLEGTRGKKPMKLAVSPAGDLVAKGSGQLVLHKPLLYQLAAAGEAQGRQAVDGGFVLDGPNRVSFRIGTYDRSRELVIDPTLAYSTYFGGDGIIGISGLALDAAGDAYVTGFADTANFPVTPGALQPEDTGFYVSKLNPAGSAVLYSTYVGVVGDEAGSNAIAVDSDGNAYVGGTTGPGFPTTNGAFQRTFAGQTESFVLKLNNTGTALLYSTYLNGPKDANGRTTISTITLDRQGNAYVAGNTTSKDFPVTKGVFQPLPPPDDPHLLGGVVSSFLSKLNAHGSGLVYSTFLGGDGEYATEVALDAAENAYVLGDLTPGIGSYPTTPGAFSKTGNYYLAKVNTTASKLVYYTLLREFTANSLAVTQDGSVYLAGGVAAEGAPTYPGQLETACDSCGNAFVIKFNPSASAPVYSAFLGKSVFDPENPGLGTYSAANSIAVDEAGDAYITGTTTDPEYPLSPDAYQKVLRDSYGPTGGGDAFVTRLDPSGAKVLYSTYLGGNAYDSPDFISLDKTGDAVIAGYTESTDFPTTPQVIQPEEGDGFAAFISKFNFAVPFCSLNADLQIAIDPDQQQGFALDATFALGSSAPLDVLTEPFTITIGSQTITVPAGKLVKVPSGYSFEGNVAGIQLFLFLQEVPSKSTSALSKKSSSTKQCQTSAYRLLAAGTGGSYETVPNPVEVTLSVGDDNGSVETTPVILK